MGWHRYIRRDPAVLTGKPVVRGTRLGVEFILGLFAAAWTQAQGLESYPQLTPEALHAVFAFTAEAMHGASIPALMPGGGSEGSDG